MARVTVEDCVLRIPNRFELVMMAGQRAREVAAGAQLTIDRDNDKNPVVALREIADETVSLEGLRESLVRGHQRSAEREEPEEEIAEIIASEGDWVRRAADEDEGEGDAPAEEAAGDEEEGEEDGDLAEPAPNDLEGGAGDLDRDL